MRKTFTAALKANVALAAIKGEKTYAELSSGYGVHTSQIKRWKKIVLEHVNDLFSDKKKQQKEKEQQQLIDELYKLIGQRDIEIAWLKKNLHITES